MLKIEPNVHYRTLQIYKTRKLVMGNESNVLRLSLFFFHDVVASFKPKKVIAFQYPLNIPLLISYTNQSF